MASIDQKSQQVTLSGRELALMRRKAQALHGKAFTSSVGRPSAVRPAAPRQAVTVAPTSPLASNSAEMLASPTPSGRQLAMQRRAARALQGLSSMGSPTTNARPTGPRPAGRVREPSSLTSMPPSDSELSRANPASLGASLLVHAANKVTGVDAGASRVITGTEFFGSPRGGSRQVGEGHRPSVMPPRGFGSAGETRQQKPFQGVTGDEPGAGRTLTGTQYTNVAEVNANRVKPEPLPSEVMISAAVVTGDRPGAGGSLMTGDECGACGLVTGSPYVGPDNMPNCSARSVDRPRPGSAESTGTRPTPSDFSIKPPARQARDRRSDESITGTDFSTRRITGPVNKANELITGTPEFRRHDLTPSPVHQRDISQATATTAAARLTGEGSQSGVQVSGDAWQSSGRVTGTEGTSSLARNPSQRGHPRGFAMNAQQFRDVERPTPAESRITGSSGSTPKGAAVTVSGGARG